MSQYHRYYHLGPYENSVCVLFRFVAPKEITLHFELTGDLTCDELRSSRDCIFKIPAHYTATVEVCEVAVDNDKDGRFLFSVQLHPSISSSGMGSDADTGAMKMRGGSLPMGECTGSGDCATSPPIPCARGKVPNCHPVNGLECVDDEPPA